MLGLGNPNADAEGWVLTDEACSYHFPRFPRLRLVLRQEILHIFFDQFVGFWRIPGNKSKAPKNSTFAVLPGFLRFPWISTGVSKIFTIPAIFSRDLHKTFHKKLLRRVIHTFHRVFHMAFSGNINKRFLFGRF